MRPSRAVAVLLVVLVSAVGMGIAEAQTPPVLPTSTTTSSTTTSTTAPGDASTTTTSTTVPPDGSQPPAPDEAGSEPPPDNVVVPPPAQPPPPPPNGPVFTAELGRQLKVAQGFSRTADKKLSEIADQAQALQTQLETWRQMLANMEVEHGRVIRRLTAAQERLRHRALGAYTGNNLGTLNVILSSGDINQVVRRTGMVESVLNESRKEVKEYQAAKKAAGDTITRLVGQIGAGESDLALAQLDLQQAYAGAIDARLQVESLAAGSAIAVKGFVFPIAAPHRFGNDFGAPRMMGTPYQHYHQGTDIFADYGAPLVSCERGVVTRIGTDTLGGTKLWVVGQSGTRYYYAHLSGFAPGLTEGLVVDAGTLVGYVGDSGNAKGGSPHLHFEVHPSGGPAVNPYFLLRAADKAGAVVAPPTSTQPAPTQAA